MTLDEEEAIHIALLSRPEEAKEYLELLATGRRPAKAAQMCGVRPSEVEAWRSQSSVYDRMCSDAEAAGTATIDDMGRQHIEAGTPGWSSAFKTLLQRRDPAYADRQQVEKTERVSIMNYGEAKPDEWADEAAR